MIESEAGRYSGAPATARRDERRSRLLDAALTVVARDGVGAVSARSLCAEAGLHARYFCEVFEAPDQVLTEAFDAIAVAVIGDAAAGIAAVPPGTADAGERKVRACVRGLFAAIDDDPRRAAVLVSADVHPGLSDRRDVLIAQLAGAMAAHAEELLDGPPEPADSQLAAWLIAVGGLHLSVAARAGRIDASPAVVEEITIGGFLSICERMAASRQLHAETD